MLVLCSCHVLADWPTCVPYMAVRSSGGAGDLRQLVIGLHQDGYSEQLAWLEAYLRDEADDRAVDGVCVCVC